MKHLIGIYISSPYQLISFMAYYFHNKDIYSKATVYIYNYWGESQIYDRYINKCKEVNIKIKNSEKNKNTIFNDLKKEKIEFDFVFTSYPRYEFFVKYPFVKNIILADGIGSYSDSKSFIKSILREKTKYKNKVLYLYLYYFLHKLFCTIPKCEVFAFYDFKTLKKNKNFITAFYNIVKMFNVESKLPKKSMVFISQPLVKLGLISSENYNEILSKCYLIAQDKGLDFYVKYHPSEENNNINYKEYKYDGIIEEACLLDENIVEVISFNSTAAINLNCFDVVLNSVLSVDGVFFYFSKKQETLFMNINKIEFKI